jgi:hypothetical protein
MVKNDSKNYNCKYLEKKECYNEAVSLPDSFKEPFDINSYSKQFRVGSNNTNFIQKNYYDLIHNTNTYKCYSKANNPPHINL